MLISTSTVALAALAVAVADRVLLRRCGVKLVNLGAAQKEGELTAFPIAFVKRSSRLKGARIEYWLRRADQPNLIISGVHRTLDLSSAGINNELLTFKSAYLTPGEWELQVRITHGDSCWNPVYRLFPNQSITRKRVIIRG